MKNNKQPHGKLIWILTTLVLCHFGTQCVSAQSTGQTAKALSPAPLKFRPPTTGAASVRVTGGSRGTGVAAVTLDVLAPDDVGTTTQAQPSLFWYQSKPAAARFELTLLEEKQVKPLVQVQVDHAAKAGIQRLRLADHGLTLAPGVEYQWVVALVTDTDLVASGVIKRIEPAADLRERIKQASPASLAGVYAESGIWYDTLATLSDQIETNPADKGLRQTRADLLQQVGLSTAAQADAAN
jgi:hypothetical protein